MQSNDFQIIVITNPEEIDQEAFKIICLLESGVSGVHIRKPNASLREVKNLIEEIPYSLRSKLQLHGHFELLNEMNLGGAHLNHRNPNPPSTALSLSKSCHSLSELSEIEEFKYVTLSPIFNSISKKDYKSKFNLQEIEKTGVLRGKNVIALGGITPQSFGMLKRIGFTGAALLGFVWQNDFNKVIESIKNSLNT